MAGTDFTPGTVLAGRFVLDDLLDENHGASFWRATDRTLVRSVAVHLLADSDERAQPLLTAARTSALVTDAHLLRVLDAAAGDGMVYVVNEWGSGVSLDRLLADGPLSARRAAWVVREVAEAISSAHRHGVSHGRLLPQNVMISEAGSVKLVGFVVDAVLHSGLRSGEDQTAEDDQRSDVRNLGALLYAALVGRWPGTSGATIDEAPTEHGRPLRPRRVRAGVPRPLDAICERVLNPQAHANVTPIESAHEVWAALSDYIGDPGAAAVDQAQQQLAGTVAGCPRRVGAGVDRRVDGRAGRRDRHQRPARNRRHAGHGHVGRRLRPRGNPGGLPHASRDHLRVADTVTPRQPPPEPRAERPLFAEGPSAAARAGGSTRGSSSELVVDPVTGEWQSVGAGSSKRQGAHRRGGPTPTSPRPPTRAGTTTTGTRCPGGRGNGSQWGWRCCCW